MTYEESSTLMLDTTFRGRIKVAGLKYSTYILAEDVNTPAHSARYRWAQMMNQMPDQQAASLQPSVVMDPQVQVDGAAVTDPNLQLAVEGVINRVL